PVADRHVRTEPRRAGPIDDDAVLEDQVMHDGLPVSVSMFDGPLWSMAPGASSPWTAIEPRTAMLDNWIWGVSLIVLTIVIHMVGVTLLATTLHGFRVRLERWKFGLAPIVAILIAAFTGIAIMLALMHGLESVFWAAAYLAVGAIDTP